MAVLYQCDGCGEAVSAPHKVGFVVKREYCEKCATVAARFSQEEESLRKATQEKFVDDRAALIARYQVDGFKLPDLPQ